ncbi:MAG: winged helix-turn-helix transcriptional regulator [Enterobacterales bacterium]|nr:winged helix-turn-helix transcriptional regulator [Enterobacterales bacterium]
MIAKHKTLDKIDRNILVVLQNNGRISNVELSKQVNLSPSPCLDRVKRLEKEGYIDAYYAILNPRKLGYDMVAYVSVTLDKTTTDSFEQFQRDILSIEEVIECDMVAGGFDYLLKLCIKNMKHYRMALGKIAEMSGVSQTHTYIVIENIKKNIGLPLSN